MHNLIYYIHVYIYLFLYHFYINYLDFLIFLLNSIFKKLLHCFFILLFNYTLHIYQIDHFKTLICIIYVYTHLYCICLYRIYLTFCFNL